MVTPKNKADASGLISIANPELAEKLDNAAEKTAKTPQPDTDYEHSVPAKHVTFNQDKWKAVITLNFLRYGTALCLLTLIIIDNTSNRLNVLTSVTHHALFFASALALLVSALCFTVLTKTKKVALSAILITQLTVDVLLTGALVHASGSMNSNFMMLFLVVVSTGSVVLRRKHAIALASGATITLFYEHFYSAIHEESRLIHQLDTLASYSALLMAASFSISYLAQRLRAAELKSYHPGDEPIEDYLIREEKSALKSALLATDGNKTEAAKLLGMTFRSLRYKLTKYDID